MDGDQLIWTGTISSRETDPAIEITELWLPWIYGINHMGRGRAEDTLYWPERAGRKIQNPYAQLAGRTGSQELSGGREPSLRLTYPFPASMQWFTLNDGEEGLYFGSHDQTLMTSCLNVMTHSEEALSASIVKYPFVKAGETWTSEPAILHDRVNDTIEPWTGEEAEDYRQNSITHPDGTVAWHGLIFDGWGNVLGG